MSLSVAVSVLEMLTMALSVAVSDADHGSVSCCVRC